MAAPPHERTTATQQQDARSSGRGSSSREGEERLPMPSRNPLPLSASQEAQVREVFNARVRKLCEDDIKGVYGVVRSFANCARNRTITIPFACRALSNAMNGCMAAHATPAEHDRAREDWFAARAERARERARTERRRLEQERFHRDWWGLPPRDPDEVHRELEKLERGERVGGKVVVPTSAADQSRQGSGTGR
ncbi:hypothetical protein SLS62_003023 [Diatrype stigma]|uniref:COX assembly mitochondrial protein n=1 Tax=Diatrype stigma TaxID=117547 RepID=A0AAN9YUL7_9PEZI